jgi:methionyl-tRNA synthetase
MAKFYLTTPLYYVNDAPHIGHAYTTVAADILARWRRLQGDTVFFLTGTDEHGQKVEQAAAARGRTPLAHADDLVGRFEELWHRLNISHDDFIRTTEARHTRVVQAVLQQLWDKQQIYADTYQGWYCLPDERFWTEKEVVDGQCPDCRRPVTPLAERNYFFKMGAYQERLRHDIEQNPSFIQPESRRNEVLGFLAQPLGDLCISRPKHRLAWGVPIPFDPDYVTYVWVDALVNYISVVGYSEDEARFAHLWPCDLHLVGKDILTTHAVYWSTLLMALGLPLPARLFAHGWWTMDGEKMSKSRGNIVDPNALIEAFGAEALRYFLFRGVPFGQDGNFSEALFITRYNSDLANDLGNLASRTITLILRLSEGVIPSPAVAPAAAPAQEGRGEEIRRLADALFDNVDTALSELAFHRALGEIWRLVDAANRYIEQTAPWALPPSEHEKRNTALHTSAEALRIIALYLSPFLPETAEKIHQMLGLGSLGNEPIETQRRWGLSLVGRHVSKGAPLFPRIEKREKQKGAVMELSTPPPPQSAPSLKPSVTIEDFTKLDLRVGVILEAERVAKSKKLLKLKVDIGAETRQVVAGIGAQYAPEVLIGRTIALIVNLQPSQIMGVESQGMLLAAGAESVLGLATFQEAIPPGTRVK